MRARPAGTPNPVRARLRGRLPSSHPAIQAARSEGRVTLSNLESRALLAAAGLVFPAVEAADSGSAAACAAERLGCPVAVKLLSRRITHKSVAGRGARCGGRRLRLARFRRDRLKCPCLRARSRLSPEVYSVLVTPMLSAPDAELLVGAYRDPHLGPTLTLGNGGTQVEILRMSPIGCFHYGRSTWRK